MAGEQEQQGTLDARERLARISHHFLSDTEPAATGGTITVRLAVLTVRDTPQTLPVHDLARALALRGRAVSVVDLADGLVSSIRPAVAPEKLAEQVRPPAGAGASAPTTPGLDTRCDIDTLMVVAQRPEPQLSGCDSVLLPVPYDPQGMYRAYDGAKRLLGCARPPTLGVTITGATGRAEAEAAFEKFARATMRFLEITPTSYAYLDGAADADQQTAQLSSIAALLLEDWRGRVGPEHVPEHASEGHTLN